MEDYKAMKWVAAFSIFPFTLDYLQLIKYYN